MTFNWDKERKEDPLRGEAQGGCRGQTQAGLARSSAAEIAGGVGGQLLSCAFPVPISEMLCLVFGSGRRSLAAKNYLCSEAGGLQWEALR